MRVLLLTGPYLPIPSEGYGGIERIVDTLVRASTKDGRVDFALVGVAGSDIACPLFVVPHGVTAQEYARVAITATYSFTPDVIHSHVPLSYLRALVKLRPSAPIIQTLHQQLSPVIQPFIKDTAEFITYVGVSRSQIRALRPLQIAAIYPGLDTERVPILRNRDAKLGFLGRLSPEKGVHIAIQAAREMAKELLVAGPIDDNHADYGRAMIDSLQAAGNCYMGEVYEKNKDAFFATCSVLLFPIQWEEPFGLVMIEAMIRGVPVVALNHGSVAEIVAPGVTGFSCASPRELPLAITAAAALAADTCAYASRSRFNSELMADSYFRLYRDIHIGYSPQYD